MSQAQRPALKPLAGVVKAEGEEPLCQAGETVRIFCAFSYKSFPRSELYPRQTRPSGNSDRPAAISNEDEGYGRNAGVKRHYYRIAIPMTELWPKYAG